MGRRYRRKRNYASHGSRGYRRNRNSRSDAAVIIALAIIALVAGFKWIFLMAAIVCVASIAVVTIRYRTGEYYKVTKNSYLSMLSDKGRYGEYLIYRRLKHFESQGAKFLFNIYIPKGNGETTEIDVMMISPKGVFVFESKNYSGWIFGKEHQTYWYQTLPSGRKSHKESFYNPIMQNNTHIRHLKALLGEHTLMRSVIVFSERCTLKDVEVQSADISVIKRNDVAAIIYGLCNQIPADLLSGESIAGIYDMLYPFTQVDKKTKAQHVENINNKVKHKESQQIQPQFVPSAMTVSDHTETNSVAVASEVGEYIGENTTDVAIESENVEIPQSEFVETTVPEQQTLLCPWCKGKLVLRTATKGNNAGKQFYGCANYPRCRFTQEYYEVR